MGTPHRGTGNFTSEGLILRLINANIDLEVKTPAILKPNSDNLIDLVEDFATLMGKQKVRDRIQVFCFFEQISTKASEVLKKVRDKEEHEKLDRSMVKVLFYSASSDLEANKVRNLL
jgi:hypothetical protein